MNFKLKKGAGGFLTSLAVWAAYMKDHSAVGLKRKRMAKNAAIGLGVLGTISYLYYSGWTSSKSESNTTSSTYETARKN